MKIKFHFSTSFILALLFLILCGAASASAQNCVRTRNDLRVTGLLNSEIKKLKAANPGKHIDIVVLVRKNTVTIVKNKTARVFVNRIIQAAKGHGYRSVVNPPACPTVQECKKGTKPCGGGGDCIPCDCPCFPERNNRGRAEVPGTKRADARKAPGIRR